MSGGAFGGFEVFLIDTPEQVSGLITEVAKVVKGLQLGSAADSDFSWVEDAQSIKSLIRFVREWCTEVDSFEVFVETKVKN